MISAAASATDPPSGTSARSSAAKATGSPLSSIGSGATDPLQDLVDRPCLQLVSDGVGDQARAALGDLLADHEAVLDQRRPGGGEVDDRLGEAGERRQLDRALDFDDLRLTTGL